MNWTSKECAQGFRNASLDTHNGRAFAGRMGESGYVCAEHECPGCGLTSTLQVFLVDCEGYCGEGHCTKVTPATVEAMRAQAIENAKSDGLQVVF